MTDGPKHIADGIEELLNPAANDDDYTAQVLEALKRASRHDDPATATQEANRIIAGLLAREGFTEVMEAWREITSRLFASEAEIEP